MCAESGNECRYLPTQVLLMNGKVGHCRGGTGGAQDGGLTTCSMSCKKTYARPTRCMLSQRSYHFGMALTMTCIEDHSHDLKGTNERKETVRTGVRFPRSPSAGNEH